MSKRQGHWVGIVVLALIAALGLSTALTWDGHPRLAALFGVVALLVAGEAGWRARKLWESEQTSPKQPVR